MKPKFLKSVSPRDCAYLKYSLTPLSEVHVNEPLSTIRSIAFHRTEKSGCLVSYKALSSNRQPLVTRHKKNNGLGSQLSCQMLDPKGLREFRTGSAKCYSSCRDSASELCILERKPYPG